MTYIFLQIWLISALAVTPFSLMEAYTKSGNLVLGDLIEWFIILLTFSHIGWLFHLLIGIDSKQPYKAIVFYTLIIGYLLILVIVDRFVCNIDKIREMPFYNKRIL